jgi:hypothetical protein
MGQRYEKAWHKLYYESPRWLQQTIVEEPLGRHASDLASEAVLLAEINNEPIICATGKNG